MVCWKTHKALKPRKDAKPEADAFGGLMADIITIRRCSVCWAFTPEEPYCTAASNMRISSDSSAHESRVESQSSHIFKGTGAVGTKV